MSASQIEPGEPDAASWSARYEASDTPWDLGGPSPLLVEALADDPGLGATVGRAYVPGCGRGHDAVALARAGWEVVAVDMAPAVEEAATSALATDGGRFVLGDALAFPGDGFDLVVDHTFFCALPLRLRPAFGAMCRRVTTPTGRVASVVFPIGRDHDEGGPPFGMTAEDVTVALGPDFDPAVAGDTVRVPGRMWDHRWAVWERVARA